MQSRHARKLSAAVALGLALGLAGAASAQATDGAFDMTLRPVRGADGEVMAVEVQQTIAGPGPAAGGPLSFAAAVTYANVSHVADRIQHLEASDATGPLTLKVEEDPPAPGGMPYYRHWKAGRAVAYPVRIRYSALVQPAGGPNGPAFGIRTSGGGVSGSGGGFLMLPENAGTTVSRVHWDLSGLAPGSMASATFGDGDFTLEGPPSNLADGWLLAGPAHRLPADGASGFQAFWLGDPPFDAAAEMAWASKAYAYMARFYGYLQPPPAYRVYMRVLTTPPFGGGTALGPSFMLSMGEGAAPRALRETIFHEMSHQWVGPIAGPIDQIAWYAEGLNVFYTTLLPLRGGLTPVEAYLQQVNAEARDYYASPARNWSAAKIGQSGFSDELVRHTPYMRGALYWAELDYQIRQRTGGRRILDDMFRPLWIARRDGGRFDQSVIERAIAKALGPAAVQAFRDQMIDGTRDVVPPSGAFGPCFARIAVKFEGPRGPVDGFQWRRLPGLPDSICRKW
jgi:hypothetical protein